jgi:homopolymeric O-antigen transport system permease protein
MMQLFRAAGIPRSLARRADFTIDRTARKNTDSLKSRTNRFDLLLQLVWRDFAIRYRKSVFGVLWSIVPTLTQLLVLVFLFKKVVPLGIEAYPAFVLSALLPWTWFYNCITSSSTLFGNDRNLVRRPNFDPSTLILVNTLVELINYLVFLPVLLAMLAFYDRIPTASLLLLPVLLLIQGVLIMGISLMTATLNVIYGDVRYMVSLAVLLLFYLTPVFYQVHAIEEKYRILYVLNPLAVLVQGYRAIFFYGHPPEWMPLLFAAVMSVAVWGLGQLTYRCHLSSMYDAL